MKDSNRPSITPSFFFREEWRLLLLTTITGLACNGALVAGPLLEGRLVQYLADILQGDRKPASLVSLSLLYVAAIAAIQISRALKRLFVRQFANHVSRSMKTRIYRHLLYESTTDVQAEGTGTVMTKAISDAEACAEGMRKATTEVFDTGVVMVSYVGLLCRLDLRLALLVLAFPPIAYIVSAAVKGKVAASATAAKQAMAELDDAAMDGIDNVLTYRIYGEAERRDAAYERTLGTYERANIIAGIWQNSPQPVYRVISLIGVVPILYFGGARVAGGAWTIAAFTAFLSCFLKLATKSSHAANLINAVQKATVSWHRIAPYLTVPEADAPASPAGPAVLEMEHVSCSVGGCMLDDLNLTAEPGTITGITGMIASGKSTLGRLFLQEIPYRGTIRYGGKDIKTPQGTIFAYMGHDPELFTGTVRDNVTFGEADEKRLRRVLQTVCIDQEVTPDTPVGTEGAGLSGGQQARVALARALFSRAPVVVLDDPFASVDARTEREIFHNLRLLEEKRTFLIISHRLALFPAMEQVALLDGGTLRTGTHEELLKDATYARLYALQEGTAHA